ncbi:hypothetical protein FHU43_0876 [Halopolyspora algeriensis]|nr:hypothetical protein FHU43_0876 [Halopolyspora algeriensis]
MLAFSLTHPDSATHTAPLKGPKRPPLCIRLKQPSTILPDRKSRRHSPHAELATTSFFSRFGSPTLPLRGSLVRDPVSARPQPAIPRIAARSVPL